MNLDHFHRLHHGVHKFTAGVLLGLLGSVMTPTLIAQEENPPALCADVQMWLSQSNVRPQVVEHSNHESFIDSKPSDQPFVVHQYYSAPVVTRKKQEIATVLSCKMRTAERINTVHSPQPPAVDSQCDAIHKRMLDLVYQQVPVVSQAVKREQWTVVEEQLTFIGPKWIEPWPFEAVQDEGKGQLSLHTRALYVPYAWWIPAPSSFLGNYYCHLASPEYLKALVRGEVNRP